MANQIQIRRDTAANWSSANPVLAQGEMGLDLTNNWIKTGDGATAWNSLGVTLRPPVAGVSAAAANVQTTGTVETTTSTTYVDLATTTDTVTVTVGPSGMVQVNLSAYLQNNTANAQSIMSFAVSGANTIAAADQYSIFALIVSGQPTWGKPGSAFLLTGLNSGSTTFKAKYRVSAGTGSITFRHISVIAF